MKKSVYIHIPFCSQICHYCDFSKFIIDNQPVDAYIEALAIEMEALQVNEAKTIFIGGGTPSALSAGQLKQLLKAIHRHIPFTEGIEFTVEANPGDLTNEKLAVLKAGGVNRLSLGVQTFNDALLQKIGRSHLSKDVLTTITFAKEAGFDNISIDLIYALPGQVLDDVKADLTAALDLNLQHISAYSLIIEPKTVFYQKYHRGELEQPGEDCEAEMYEYVMDTLSAHGFHQYEISNYAMKGHVSEHNLTYWNNEEYYGVGVGAHGYIDGVRYANVNVLKKYLAATTSKTRPILSETPVSTTEKMAETMFLGLRRTQGVSQSAFQHLYGKQISAAFPAVDQLLDKGLLMIEDETLRLTRQGKLLGNEVFEVFID